MLLHDIGKPESCPDGYCKYYNYTKLSAEIAERILRRLKYSKNFIDDCLKLIEYQDVRLYNGKKNLKRVMNIVGVDNARRLIKIQQAIKISEKKPPQKTRRYCKISGLLCAAVPTPGIR